MIGDDYFQTRAELGAGLTSVSRLAQDLTAPPEVLETLQQLQQSLHEPFLFVVVGEVKAGKSSLLNAIFGSEISRVDVLPATDKVYVFKYGDEDRTVHINERLAEVHRPVPFLRDFNIVDTPGTNTIVAEHQTITEQFLPLSDLVLFVFSAPNPWAASAWEFLKFISKKWLKRVIFVVQQADLRSAEEIAQITRHLEQTMLERIGQACPIFAVSAKQALTAKQSNPVDAKLLAHSGFEKLEGYINEHVARGESRIGKLRSVCQTAQVLLRDLGEKVRASMLVVMRDSERLDLLQATLEERKQQSIRQIGGVLWSLSQTYDKSQKRGEELLLEKLTLVQTVKLILNKGDWRHDFQESIEGKLREGIQRQVENSLELLEDDLKSVWQHLHETLQKEFSGATRSPTSLPDFLKQRDELLRRIALTLLERGSGQQVEQQLGRLFAETAQWLRVPAGVAAAGGVATIVAALVHTAAVDVTGTVAGIAAVFGTVVALTKRRKILAAFREQMTEKRETVLAGIEDHLRHAIDRFYAELATTFEPLRTFCAAQRKLYEPMLARLSDLDSSFGKNAAALATLEAKPLPVKTAAAK